MNTKRLAGNVRTLFLIIIAEQGPIYGLEVAREYQARTGSSKALNAGTLYPNLRRLEQLGWVSVEEKDPPRGRIPVRCYSLTEAGRQALPDEIDEAMATLEAGLAILKRYTSQQRGYTKTMYTLDRFEDNDLAVLESNNGTTVDVPREQVPPEAKEGDILIDLDENEFDGEVRFAVDFEASEQRRREVSNLRDSISTVDEGDIEL